MSNDVDVIWAELSFKEGDFEPLLNTLQTLEAVSGEEVAPPVKEWTVLNTTDLGDGKILEVRVLEPIPTKPAEEKVIDRVAELLNEILPGGLDAMVGWPGNTLTIEGGDSMGWRDAELLGNLLGILAPFLDEGSEIQLCAGADNIWRLVVRDGKIAEQAGRITFDD